MMEKKIVLLGLAAGILSGTICTAFSIMYKETMMVDFSPVIKIYQYYSACILGCMLASFGFMLLKRITQNYGEILFNLLFTFITIISILGPLLYTFPPALDVKGIDEITSYFQPFTITLHFFPALAWFTLKPIFKI